MLGHSRRLKVHKSVGRFLNVAMLEKVIENRRVYNGAVSGHKVRPKKKKKNKVGISIGWFPLEFSFVGAELT